MSSKSLFKKSKVTTNLKELDEETLRIMVRTAVKGGSSGIRHSKQKAWASRWPDSFIAGLQDCGERHGGQTNVGHRGKTHPTADGRVKKELSKVLGRRKRNLKVMKRLLLSN